MERRPGRHAAALLAVLAAYLLAGKLGLRLASVNPSATAIWAPTGIALAAFLLLGRIAAAPVFLGAFLVNLTTAGTALTSLGVALGNTLEGFAGAWLLRRFANGARAYSRAADVFKATLLAGFLAPGISASLGVASLAAGGYAPWSRFGSIWFTWWLGDLGGALVVAPAAVLWALDPRPRWSRRQGLELVAALAALLAVEAAVFGRFFSVGVRHYPVPYLTVPLLVYIAFRFTPREAATACLLCSAIATLGTARGYGPFTVGSLNESLLLLLAYASIVSVTMLALAAEVAERRRTATSLTLLKTAVDDADEGVLVLTSVREGRLPVLTFVSDGFCRIAGAPRRELQGRPLDRLKEFEVDPDFIGAMRAGLAERKPFRAEFSGSDADRGLFTLEWALSPVTGSGARAAHWVGVVRDITEPRRRVEALRHQALYDFLTGLPNRALLEDRLEQAISRSRRDGSGLALFLMDLDRFKEINDAFGHPAGDLLLRQLGARLRTLLRGDDTVARLGGDEFAMVLPAISDEEAAVSIARKVLAQFDTPFLVDSRPLLLSGSIGVALFPEHGDTAALLLRHADAAMYLAKRTRAGHSVYSSAGDLEEERLSLMGELRTAIAHGALRLHYQPKVSFHSGGVARVEALLRWQHPRRGLLLPEEFLQGAERTGLIGPITDWVLDEALEQCRRWRQAGLDLRMAVNLSSHSLQEAGLRESIVHRLNRRGLNPAWLKLELPESSVLSDPLAALQVLTELRSSGVRLGLDHFGTGYSSLGYLKKLPVDEIKIDQSFVGAMVRDEGDATIVRSIIGLAHNLGRKVVAEGIEDEPTWEMLRKLGCDLGQGNFLCPPLPADRLERWLQETRWILAPEFDETWR